MTWVADLTLWSRWLVNWWWSWKHVQTRLSCSRADPHNVTRTNWRKTNWNAKVASRPTRRRKMYALCTWRFDVHDCIFHTYVDGRTRGITRVKGHMCQNKWWNPCTCKNHENHNKHRTVVNNRNFACKTVFGDGAYERQEKQQDELH